MRHIFILPILLLLLLPALSSGQGTYSRRRAATATANSGPYSGPAVTFHGTVKALSKKELLLELDAPPQADEEQSVTFRLSRKTKFFKNEREIKAAEIVVGTTITLDATRDGDLKLSALNVIVAPPPAKQ